MDGDADLPRVSEEQGEDESDVQDAQDDEDEQDLFIVGDSELQMGQTFSDITSLLEAYRQVLNAYCYLLFSVVPTLCLPCLFVYL